MTTITLLETLKHDWSTYFHSIFDILYDILKMIYKSQRAVSEFWKIEVLAMKVLPEVADSLLGEERLQRVECSEKGEPGLYEGKLGEFSFLGYDFLFSFDFFYHSYTNRREFGIFLFKWSKKYI